MAQWGKPDRSDGAVDWPGVTLFMAVACGWSWIAVRWSPLDLPGTIFGLRIDDALLVGFGPALGAIVAGALRRGGTERTVTMLGRVPWAAWLALAAPILTAALFGMPKAAQPWLAGLVFAATVVLYCIGEEIGWRGWLFDALRPLPLWQGTLVTAFLWYGWHWTFLAELWASAAFALQFALFVLVGSAGLAQAVSRSRSIGIAAAIHAALKVMLAPAQIAAMAGLIALALWKSRPEVAADEVSGSPQPQA